jgi:dipeptidyl aminopeptidase/acylaminoacyl peptidase
MKRDIRDTALYREAEALYSAARRPGSGLISDATEVCAHGSVAVFTGTLVEKLDGSPQTRICRTDLDSGETRAITFGPNSDRSPKFSPDGRRIAFLSDRHKAGDFQLYLLDPDSGAVQATRRPSGWVEYLQWSPDSQNILLGVAGHGAETSSGQGAIVTDRTDVPIPSWTPMVEAGTEDWLWRSAWIYDVATGNVRQLSPDGINVWEAVWCGNDAVAAVVSRAPREGLWYAARLNILQLQSGECRHLYTPQDQLGCLAASPSGADVAIVEALCSDRGLVAGRLLIIDARSGRARNVDTGGVDITCTEWRSERQLLWAGHRGFETVTGFFDTTAGRFAEIWSSCELSTAGYFATVSALDEPGDCVLIGEGFRRAPEVAVIRRGHYRTVWSCDVGYAADAQVIDSVERVTWKGRDELEIQGWVLRPAGEAPYRLVMNVHGGPVWHWHPTWLGRRTAHALMLLRRGYAVFLPNPRGSSGRGRDFVEGVSGKMGGEDAYDCLRGIDHLVAQGIADSRRLGVMGNSYGGYMAAWLITQDSRFAAAVPVSPITNLVTTHLVSNIPECVTFLVADTYDNSTGKYFERSPVMHARKAKTPTLNICGALDRCAPPEEAIQFHNALLANGVHSVLVTYPEEGHGVRKFPAIVDFAARVVGWFEEHIPARA